MIKTTDNTMKSGTTTDGWITQFIKSSTILDFCAFNIQDIVLVTRQQNIPQSQEDTYMRPQSECLAMFFNVKAAVSRMCLVTGPSFSSWERKQTRIIFSRSGS